MAMNIAPSEDNSGDTEDQKAVDTLESSWAKQVRTTGFKDSKYIKSLGTIEMSGVISQLQSSMPKQESSFSLSPFSWLEKVWNQPDFEVAEALCIMLAAKTDMMHNTQIDFLSRPGGNVNSIWVQETALSKKEFERKIGQHEINIPKDLYIYRSLKNEIDKKNHVIWDILLHPKVADLLSWRIKDKELEIWQSEKGKKDFIKANSRLLGEQAAADLYNNFLITLNTRKPTEIKKQWIAMQQNIKESIPATIAEIDYYQPLISDWYKRTHFNISFTPDINIGTYYNELKQAIHKQFLKDLEQNKNATNIMEAMYSNSILSIQWPFIQSKWQQFYDQQMSIEYGGKFGALQQINKLPDAFGEYAFGRPNIVDDNGQMIKLFTSPDPNLEDRVHTFEQMTIF